MTNGVSRKFQYMHIAVFTQDAAIFALAKDERTKKLELFLIRGDEEKVYRRNGRDDRWQLLERTNLAPTLQSICQAIAQGQEVHQIDGKSDGIINRSN